jgi:hypothetical protein
MFKKLKKKYSDDTIAQIFSNGLANLLTKRNASKADISNAMQEVEIVTLLYNYKYNNYFVDSFDLGNFFKNTKIKKEIIKDLKNIVSDIAQINFKDSTILNIEKNEVINGNVKRFLGCIFLKNLSRSLFFNISLLNDHLQIYVTNGDDNSSVEISDNPDKIDFINNDSEMIRIVLNLIFYMSAFPEYVTDKPPQDMCEKSNINNSKTISLSKDIADYLHETRDIAPHLRRGHFRYLGSEHFTKKKGQTIFVKSSFVKGQAKTILDGGLNG